ncbi:MAG: hypothetical protein GXP33_00295 [Spirochaetes bacterium]|nr:hypothetical protein [Spirochaetota bacterium]
MGINNVFKKLFLIGRPAAGKSEVIDYLKKVPLKERKADLHIGDFTELDDFPIIWSWFEEDKILSDMDKPRLHTDENGYFKYSYLWCVLIKKLEFDYRKVSRESKISTFIIEFSRGSEHGGYKEAFRQFSKEMLVNSAVLYIDVSFEESMRKNRKRFNPERPYSILEHALPDEKLARLYGGSDWEEISGSDPDYLTIHDVKVPYSVFENNDDVTTAGGERLGARLKKVFDHLWELYK